MGRVKRNKVVIHRTGIGQIMCIYDSSPELCSFPQIKSLTLQLSITCPTHVAEGAKRKIIVDNYMTVLS